MTADKAGKTSDQVFRHRRIGIGKGRGKD
jgi:hypothetical protein